MRRSRATKSSERCDLADAGEHLRVPANHEPDWPAIHQELKRKHVTLMIVSDE